MPRPSLPDFYKIIQPELFEKMGKTKEKSNPPPATLIPGAKEWDIIRKIVPFVIFVLSEYQIIDL